MKHPVAEIFSQGEEVVTGQIADTNAAWLSQQLVQMGFVIKRHTSVGDKLEELIDLLIEISNRSDFCICTGGLGPTIDDLTADAVARAFDRPLQLDTDALMHIERYFLNRNRQMADSNRKQAYFPQGASRIDNDWGTAPGFALQYNRCWFVFVPGVPTEMRHMFYHRVKAELEKRFTLVADKLFAIKTIGIGESDLQQKINELSLSENIKLSFRAAPDEVQTKLLFPAETDDTEIRQHINRLLELLGDKVYAIDESNKAPTDLVSVVNQLMTEKDFTLSLLETASQGLMAAKCVGKAWLQESAYKQSIDQLKTDHGLSNQDELDFSAQRIAGNLNRDQQTDLTLVQLYQGNKNQLQDKDSSIVLYNTLLTPDGIFQKTITVTGPIKRKQNQAAVRGLDLLRRYLQNSAFNTIK